MLIGAFLVFSCAGSAVVVAQENQRHRAQIDEMLTLMGVPTQVNSSADDVLTLYLVKVDETTASDEVTELVNAYRDAMTKLVDDNLRWVAVKEYYVDAYVEHLNAEDAAKVTEFIKSSAGKNFIASQTQASQTIQAITRERIDARLTMPAKKLSTDLRESLNAINSKNK